MSSFFRKPNDVTESEDQTYDDDELSSSSNDEDEKSTGDGRNGAAPKLRSAQSNALRKISTLDSTTSSTTTNAGALSRQLTVEDSAKQETKDSLMLVLLEDKCLNDALAAFEASNTSGKPYTKDDPEVRALADDKFKYMLDMLGRANILPSGSERRDSASRAIKQQARDGLEFLSTTSPQPGRPGVLHRDSSLQSLQSGIRDLILAQSTSHTMSQIPLYHQAALTHNMDAVMGLPPLLRPLVDHPMFSLSRYARDFVEVRMVGRGGYGKVYHVQHRLDGSNYAVKKINLNAQRLRRIQERGQAELDGLLNELRMLARFDHPNIVRYYGGWLEHSANTPFPSPAPNGNLLIEAPPAHTGSEDAQAAAGASDELFHFADSKRSSVDILFEHSSAPGGEILGDLDEMDEQDDLVAELQPQIRTTRKRAGSESTTASGRSKLSSVHSVGPEGEDEVPVARTTDSVSLSDAGASESSDVPPLHDARGTHFDRSGAESVLTLHIQMALHPLSLADYLTPNPSSSPSHCFHLAPSLHILLGILDGVQYLHASGVVHRDLKPSNVFLTLHKSRTPACVDLGRCGDCVVSPGERTKGGEKKKGYLNARIGDFGLVTEIARATASPNTTSADLATATPAKAVGTELYRPPSSTNPHTHASSSNEYLDVYALGIILVELLVPFGTRMERQRTLVEAREGRWEDTGLVVRLGGVGREVHRLVGEMLGGGVGCEEVRGRVEDMLAALDG